MMRGMRQAWMTIISWMAIMWCAGVSVGMAAPDAKKDQLTPKQSTQFLHVAQRLAAKGDVLGAMNFYNKVLESQRDNVDALAGVADLLVASSSPLEAVPYFQKLQSLQPNNLRHAIGLIRAYNRADRPQEALNLIDKATKDGATGPGLLTERGLALDLLGMFKEAQLAYGDALKISPKNRETLQRLAFSFAITEEYPTALSILNQVANEPGGTDQVRNPLAVIYAVSGQLEQAIAILRTTPKITPEDVEARRPFLAALPRLDRAGRTRALQIAVLPAGFLKQAAAEAAPPPPVVGSFSGQNGTPGRPQMVALPPPSKGDKTPPPFSAPSLAPPPAAGGDAGSFQPAMQGQPKPPGDRIWIQLGIAESRAALDRQWRALFAQAPSGLSGLAPYMQPTVFKNTPQLRLVVGGYMDNATAVALLDRLKKARIKGFISRNGLAADPLYP